MKRFLTRFFGIAVLCCLLPLLQAQEEDALTVFRKETSAFSDTYKRAVKENLSLKTRLKNEKDRIKSRYEIDDNDTDSERKSKRNRRKNELQRNRDAKKKVEKNIITLRDNVNQYEVCAVNLQAQLNARGIGALFHFNYYAQEIRLAFSGSKIKTDYSKDSAISLTGTSDPSIMLWAIKNEMAWLDAGGIDFNGTPVVPELYENYKTFFRYYQNYEICCKIVEICAKADSPSYTMQKELAWRLKLLGRDADSLHRLVRANHPRLAQKTDLIQFTKEFISYVKKNSSKSGDFGSKVLNSLGDDKKNKLLTETGFKKDFAEQILLLKEVATDVRPYSMVDVTRQSPSAKTKRNKNQNKTNQQKKFKNAFTPFFADAPGKVAAALLSDSTDKEMLSAISQRNGMAQNNPKVTDPQQPQTPEEIDVFLKKRNEFRKKFAHTNDLIRGGMDGESVVALKLTMTPTQCQRFEEIMGKAIANGQSPEFAAATAYSTIHSAEIQGKYKLTPDEIDVMRDQMDAYLARKEVKQTEDNQDNEGVVFMEDDETPDGAQSDADDDGVEWE